MKTNHLLQSFEFFYLNVTFVWFFHDFGRYATMVVGKVTFSQSVVYILKVYVVPCVFL